MTEVDELRGDMNRMLDSQDRKLLSVAEEHSEVLRLLIERLKVLEQKNKALEEKFEKLKSL